MSDPVERWFAHRIPIDPKAEAWERDRIADGWACTGCGSKKTMAEIRAEHPYAVACCPERELAAPTFEGGSPT